MASVTNINEVLEGHVTLQVECVDRLYLNAYVPRLQVGGQVVAFLTGHLGNRVPSPVLFERIGNRFRREVKAFAAERGIPVLRLKKPDRSRWDDRKLDHVRPYLERAERDGVFGVVAIVAAQEFQWVCGARNRSVKPGVSQLRVQQGGAAGRRLLLLRPRPRVWARLHQDLHLLSLSGQGVGERARVGEAAGRAHRRRVRVAQRRVC